MEERALTVLVLTILATALALGWAEVALEDPIEPQWHNVPVNAFPAVVGPNR